MAEAGVKYEYGNEDDGRNGTPKLHEQLKKRVQNVDARHQDPDYNANDRRRAISARHAVERVEQLGAEVALKELPQPDIPDLRGLPPWGDPV